MTELEMSMTNWLAKALQLPAEFLNTENGCGMGIIQNSASDATYIAIVAARGRAIEVSLIVYNLFHYLLSVYNRHKYHIKDVTKLKCSLV